MPADKFKRRRLKLARFLDTLPAEKFNIDIMFLKRGTKSVNDCGSVSCALGWCPVVFPKLVKAYVPANTRRFTLPAFTKGKKAFTVADVEDFFGIDEAAVLRIFYNNIYSSATGMRTAADVASDLRAIK